MLPAPAYRAPRPARALAVLCGAALALAGCGAAQEAQVAPLAPADVKAQLATTPDGQSPAARRLEQQAGQVLPSHGDPQAQLAQQVNALRGTPVVVNVWGDWCVPCRKEMPIFQRTALSQRGKAAFLGVATASTRAKTQHYLDTKIAMPYPSILDGSGRINQGTGVDNVPKTLFYDRAGKRVVHIGPYASQADLEADIKRYAS